MTLLNSGIYKIINLINNKFYIGSAKNFDARFLKHKWCFENQCHPNKYLQASWNKYGANAFEFHILERCSINNLIEREQLYIDTLKPQYNLAPKAGSNLGVKYTEESKKKMSAWQIGRKMSDEAKAKMSAKAMGRKNALGYKHTEETKTKMALASSGRKHKEETKLKIGISALGNKSKTGQKQSEAEKLKKRKLDKWPHAGGSKCPCRECLTKRSAMFLARYHRLNLENKSAINNGLLSFGC